MLRTAYQYRGQTLSRGAGGTPVEEGDGPTIEPEPNQQPNQPQTTMVGLGPAPFRHHREAPLNSPVWVKLGIDIHSSLCILFTMGNPLNAQAATPDPDHASSGVVMPANWFEVASRSGYEPSLVPMYAEVYGWKVGTHIQEVPPVELVMVDATSNIFLGTLTVCLGILFAVVASFRDNRTQPSTTQE